MPTTPQPALRVRHATKSFRRARKALDDVSFEVQAGECVGLLGASGSGKSTLLRSLCGLETVSGAQSSIDIFGEVLQSQGVLSPQVRRLRQDTGIIFQQFNLVGRLSVLHNVLLGQLARMPLWRVLSARFTEVQVRQALSALDAVGLADQALQRSSTLSGGQQQRVAVARSLMQGARVLLADEPVSSLDPESARRVMDLLRQLQRSQGMTLVISLHDVDMARRYCDRIVALKDGRLVFDGPPRALSEVGLQDLYGAHAGPLHPSESTQLSPAHLMSALAAQAFTPPLETS